MDFFKILNQMSEMIRITNRNFELQLARIESGGLCHTFPFSEPELIGGGLTPNSRRQGCTQGCSGWVVSGEIMSAQF